MKETFFKKHIGLDGVFYLLILALVLTLRYLVLVKFAFKYTDSDQSIMWLGLKDYSSGVFHEPRFYGQAYNSMLEALFAVPFYKLGLPAYKALPFITSLFTLLPFIIISLFTFFKKSTKLAFVILSIPLLLPVEYSLITTLPRGFVTGVFTSVFGCIGVFYTKSKWSFFFCGFIAVLAYSINSNSVLLSFSYLLILFFENIKNKQFYTRSLLGIGLGLIVHLTVAYFYVLNPYYNLHTMDLNFSVKVLIESFYKLDVYFNNIMPIFWNTGFLILLLFLLLGIYFFIKKQYPIAVTTSGVPFIIILTLGINKIHDGTVSIFFSYSRMYLALPVLLAFCLSFINPIKNVFIAYIYLIMPVAFFIYQIHILDTKIISNTSFKINHVVSVGEVDKSKEDCKKLQNICAKNKVDLIIVSSFWSGDFLTYGCQTCTTNFPKTLNPSYDRRTWRYTEDEKTVYKTILIIDIQRDFAATYNFIKKFENEPYFYLIENNTTPTIDLLYKIGIPPREYK